MKLGQTKQISSPIVSIIIPSYNYARFLPDAVDSALAQTYRPIEVLIIDDGSTDGTRDLVESRYGKKPEIRYIYKENQGLSAARNTGIQEARGSWLAFLDADDRLLPQFIIKSLEAYSRLPETVALVAGQVSLIDAQGQSIPDRIYYPSAEKEISTIDLLVMNRFAPAVMVKKEAFEACGLFDIALKASEDRDMWIRISGRCRIFRLSEKLLEVRRHGKNMSSNGLRQAACIRQVLLKAYRSDVIKGWHRIYWMKIISYYLYQIAILDTQKSLIVNCLYIFISILLWPFHADWKELGKKSPLFRVRMIVWLIKQRKIAS